jgi:hypothetical protein
MVGKFYTHGLSRGLIPTDLAFYAESAKKIVDKEMALRH